MMNAIKKSIFRNNLSLYLRNQFNIKPVDTYYPNYVNASVSDFFYWNCQDEFNTKFMLTNIASHILPNIPQDDLVKLYIFDHKGKILKISDYLLKPYQTKEIIFSDFGYNNFGSFFVFHNFKDMGNLKDQGSYIAERGYVGYKRGNNIWNFMHGNYNACYLSNDNNIYSIISSSLFLQSYYPQVSFSDTANFKIILNNPTKKQFNINVKCYNNLNVLIDEQSKKIEAFNTEIFSFNNKLIDYVEIISKILFCRPIIYKQYKTYFDIFHG